MIAPAARSTRTLVVLAFIAVCVVWGSTYLAIRVSLEGFPPFLGGAFRFLLAGSFLFVVLRARGERAPTAIEWRGAAITGALFFVFSNGFVILAEQSVPSGLVSVMVAEMTLWATLFERFTGTRVGKLEWMGIALGLAGVVVLNLGGELRASGAKGNGALFGLIAPMSWALGSVVSKRLTLPKGAMCTASQMLCGGALMGVAGGVLGERFDHAPPARAIFALAYLLVFGSLVGFTAYIYLLHHTRMSVATSYAYVNPVIALALGVFFGGERIDRASAVGAAVVLAAVVLITRARGEQEPKVEPATRAESRAG
jgi:drug/metabolite transporter (DMT)-like permease